MTSSNIETPQNVIFIDSGIPDLQDLLNGLAPGEQAFVINPASDGLAQIAAILAANDLTNLASISIVGHGTAGAIILGSTTLDDADLANDSAALAQIGAAIAPGGTLQLYSCDTASGAAGQQFIADLSQFAGGVSIAASDQDIGQTAGGENWNLDVTAGAPASPPAVPFTQAAMANFQGDLSATPIDNDQPSLGMTQLVVTDSFYPARDGDPLSDPGGIPLGALETFAGNFAIGGTLQADGQTLALSSNTALFSLLGITYGGDGRSNFELPNLQDALTVGTGGTSNPLGTPFGSDNVTLTAQNMPALYDGGRQPFDNEQPSLQINYLIDVGGSFPVPGDGAASTDVMGEIIPFLGNFAPDGYLLADGQSLAISQYSALFDLIGTTYGGDGQTTFDLPNLNGATIIGTGTANGATYTLGETVGQNDTTIANNNLPTDGDSPIDNYQPAVALNYLICIAGVFPTQDGTPLAGEAVLGQIVAYAGSTNQIPAGWALCNGQLLDIDTNQALFSVLGTTYGGDGRTDFALPNLDGRSVAGVGTGGDGQQINVGESYGSATIKLNDSEVTLTASQPSLAAASQTGPVQNDTAFNTPVITGTALPDATIQLFDESNQNIALGTTVADSSGNYTFVTPSLLPGANDLAVVETIGSIVSPESSSLDLSIAPADAYFLVSTGQSSAELWRSDGAGVQQINPTSGSFSDPASLTQAGTQLFFVDAESGALWVTDGLSSRTNELTSNGVQATDLTAVGTTLYFVNSSDNSLWISNGASLGTEAVGSADGLVAEDLTAVGNTLFFVDGKTDDLWTVVNGFAQDVGNFGTLTQLTAAGSELFFVDSSTGELWESDGTSSGTVEVAGNESPTDLTAIQNRVYFVDSATGDLWLTDAAGASLVDNLDIDPSYLTATQTGLFFIAGNQGDLVFFSNFSTAKNIVVIGGNAVTNAADLTAVGNNLFFVSAGTLYEVDAGSIAATTVASLGAGPLADFASVDGELYFQDNGKLWVSDGTSSGTKEVPNAGTAGSPSDITAGPQNPTLAISQLPTLNAASGPQTVTFTFSAPPSGFSAVDVTTVGGSIGSVSEQSADVYLATFTPTSGFDGQGSISVADGDYTDQYGVIGTGDEITFSEDTDDQAPVAVTPAADYTAIAGTPLDLKNTGLSVSDVDAGNGSETVTVSVGEGTLTVTVGDSGVTVDSGNATSSVQFSGTIAELNALLGAGGTSDLTYGNNATSPTATTLTLSIDDDGNTGPGGPLSDTATATIDVKLQPTLTTTASPDSAVLALSAPVTLSDSAVLAGGVDPTGSITFTLTGPDGFSYTQLDTVSLNGAYTASTMLPDNGIVAGTYTWSASYGGDANNGAASDQGGAAEQTIIAAASPTLTTTASPAVALSDAAVTLSDSAVLAGGFDPTGSITFTLTLDSTTVYTTSDTVNGNNTYTADYTLPTIGTVAGTYTWSATYGGDANNNTASDQGGAAEQTIIAAASPTLTTTASPAVALSDAAVTLSDSAVLAGGFDPTGSITFTLTLDSTTVYTTSDTVNGNNTYTADYTLPTIGTVAGTYTWSATYGGDANNNTASDQGGAAEQTIVAAASPTLTTTAGPAVALSNAAVTLSDSAVLAGGFDPTGSITFTLTLGSTTVYTTSDTVNGNNTYTADYTLPTIGTVAGTYTWSATYGGDANNNTASDQGGAAEQTIVAAASPTLTTTASPAVALSDAAVTLSDSAVLAGGFDPTGSITFTLTLDSTTVYTTSDTVNGNNTYTADYTLPTIGTVAGTYTWSATYGGDANNNTASDQGGAAEQTIVAAASPTLTTTAGPAVALSNAAVTLSDSAVLAGGYNETSAITFTLTGPNGFSYTQLDTVSLNGTYTASTTLPTIGTIAGTYTWSASYGGDTNNSTASDQGGAAEQTIVAAASPTLTTMASSAATLSNTSVTLSDSAVLAGGYNETGAITFTLTGPNGFSYTQLDTVNLNGTYTASTTLPTIGTVAGTYTWSATYGGDANNNTASDQGGAAEQTIVAAASPTLTTTASPDVTLSDAVVTLSDSAVLAGGYNETGAIIFTLTGPNGFSYNQTDTVSLNGTYTASTTLLGTGTIAGTYTWSATYGGDTNNSTVSDQGGAAEQTIVAAASPTLTTTAGVGLSASSGTITLSDSADLAGGYDPTGTVTFTLTNPSGTIVDTEMDTVNGNGTYSTLTGYTFASGGAVAGAYTWSVSYSGDPNNSSETASAEPTAPTPTVTAASANVTASASEIFAASQLFTASSSLSILTYEVEDESTGANQGFWVLDGAVLPNGQITTLTAAQLAQLSFVAGSAGAPVTDTLEVAASDAAGLGAFASFTVTASAHASTAAPIVTAANELQAPGLTLAASSLFSGTAFGGNSIVSYEVEDTTPDSGHWIFNGTIEPTNQVIDVTVAQLAQLSFETGYGSDTLMVRANDGSQWGSFVSFTVTPPPNAAPPSGTTDTLVMLRNANGAIEFYDIGRNQVLLDGPLGQINPALQVAGVGGFDGSDTADLLMRDPTTGAFTLYDVSNNNITGNVALGQVGPEWTVAGFGDFSGHAGETDMVMRNANTGAFELYDISHNTVTSAAPLGQVGLEWQVAGFGDFSGQPDASGMLLRNSNTGAFEVYDIANNTVTSATGMGQVGTEWQVAGFGDFSGNANETDMLMRNSNTGAFEVYDIVNNAVTSATSMGQVGLEWTVAGFGDFSGNANETDMLMRNANTGAFELYDISRNTVTAATGIGPVGTEWSVSGVSADPAGAPPATQLSGIAADPAGAAPSSATAQLTQAMASFAPAGAATSVPSPLGQATLAPSIATNLLTTPNQTQPT